MSNADQKAKQKKLPPTPARVTIEVKPKGKPSAPSRGRSGPRKEYKRGKAIAVRSVRDTMRSSPHASRLHRLSPKGRALAAALLLPRECDPVRIGNGFGGKKTAIAHLFRKSNIQPGTISGTTYNPDIPNTNTAAFAFRDPLRSFVQSIGLSATDFYAYENNFQFTATERAVSYPLFFGGLNVDSTYPKQPHGPILFPGRLGISDPHRGWLCNKGDVFRMTIAARPAALITSLYTLTVHQLKGSIWQAIPTVALSINQQTGGSVNVIIIDSGYFSFNIFTDTNGTATSPLVVGTLSIEHTPNSNPMIWGQMALPRIEEQTEAIKAYRITAVSLMLTNTAAPINRAGQVTAYQFPEKTSWLENVDYEELASADGAYTLNIVNGMYAFLKPTKTSDFDMTTFQYETDDDQEETVFNLLPESDYLAIQANVNIADGRQGIFTPAHHIEFETLSQWHDTEVDPMRVEVLNDVLSVVSYMPQYHENDFHIADLWQGIKTFASDVWSGVKEVGSTLLPLAPLLLG